MQGQGESGFRGGPPGDLQIVVNVMPHKLFKRNGADLLLNMPISFTQAALGANIDVPLLKGSIKYNIPEGTQSGAKFRIKGEGIQRLNSKIKGDLIFTVTVETPKRLSEKQKELLREFEKAFQARNTNRARALDTKTYLADMRKI